MATPVSTRRPAPARRPRTGGASRGQRPLAQYRLRRRVQFHETDKAGIVHFSAYFKYMEEAEHGLWRAAGLSISPRESDIGWPRVHASMDFHAALHFEEEFTVLVQVAAITTRAIRYRFLLARDRTRIATGALTVVCVRKRPRQPMRSVPIPPAIASRFRVAAGANANLS